MTAPRPAYPEVGEFVFPTPGVRKWQPPQRSFFGTCSAAATAGDHVCPVGVYKVRGRVMGCDCLCHATRRTALSRR